MKTLTKTLPALVLAFAAAHLWAAGPTGIGGLQIGMTKAQVEALDKSAEVYLSTPLTPVTYETDPGEEKYNTMLVAPFSKHPLITVLTFEGGELQELNVYFKDPDDLDLVNSAIASKHGNSLPLSSNEAAQCQYEDGTNFNVVDKITTTRWILELRSGDFVITEILTSQEQKCPAQPTDEREEAGMFVLSISKIDREIFSPSLSKQLESVF